MQAIDFCSGLFGTIFQSLIPQGYISPSADKAILITGCDTGFGRQTAVHLADLGFTVYAACLLDKSLAPLRKEGGKNMIPIKCDVTKPKEVDVMVKQIREETGGHLQAVINNAGISGGMIVEFTPLEDYKRVMEVNFFALVDVTTKVLDMIQQNEGTVVNVSSLAGRVASPAMAAYASSKYAVQAFSDSLRAEMRAFNVNVVLIEPSFIKTPIIASGMDAFRNVMNNADQAVVAKYGGKRLSRYMSKHEKLVQHLADDPQLVVDAMTDAVMAKRPYTRYTLPFIATFISHAVKFTPTPILDYCASYGFVKAAKQGKPGNGHIKNA
eukprot:Clim_evm11s156 gene=Clim_evmTU11s156